MDFWTKLVSLGQCPPGCIYALNLWPVSDTVSPNIQVSQAQQSRGINGNDLSLLPLVIFYFLPVILLCPCVAVLVLQGEVLPLGDTTMIPLTWKLRLPPNILGLLMPLNWQAKRRVDVLSISRVTDTDYQGKIGVLLDKQKGGRAFLGYRRSPQKSLSTTMPCDPSQWKSTAIKRRQDC